MEEKIEKYIKQKKIEKTYKIRISHCKWCGRPFIKQQNKQQYCSTNCRKDARAHQSRMKSHRWYHRHKHELTEKQRWGLGSGTIGAHRHKDYHKEQEVITRELKRLGIYRQTRK